VIEDGELRPSESVRQYFLKGGAHQLMDDSDLKKVLEQQFFIRG
jgi:hypothetical protein